MNVQLPESTGRGFKGSILYLTHDKRLEGMEQYPTTAERVDWALTRNMGALGPQGGMRCMIDTAQRADELKAAAGIKSTGRKATGGPVYHFSINWHPDERGGSPDQAEMLRAADEVLRVLGFEECQAVMVAHRDRDHSHLHVVVNRVHPQTGKTISAGPARGRALDRWSHDYEVAGGRIFSPDRAAKYAELDRKREQHPEPEKRREYVEEKRARNADRLDSAARMENGQGTVRDEFTVANDRPLTRGEQLKARKLAMKARHEQEREQPYKAFYAAKNDLWNDRPSFKAIATQHKAETRFLWSSLGKRQAQERKEFWKLERQTFGALAMAVAIVRDRGLQFGDKGFLGAVFAWWVAPSQTRFQALQQDHEKEKAELGDNLKRQLDEKIRLAKEAHAARLQTLVTQYETAKQIRAARQADERRALAQEERAHYDAVNRAIAARRAAPAKRRSRGEGRTTTAAKAPWQQATTPQTKAPKTRTAGMWERAAQQQQPTQKANYWSGKDKPQRSADRTQAPERGKDFKPPER